MPITLAEYINEDVISQKSELANKFQNAKPFPHIGINEFFKPAFLSKLVQQFPSMNAELVRTEGKNRKGEGLNYGISDVGRFPAAFVVLDKLVGSDEFLSFIENITGLNGLLYDPDYLGGGIKTSYNGAILPRHIDFNYHQKNQGLLRCLNILFYFNEDWEEEWGGNIQVHNVPKKASDNTLVKYFPPSAGSIFLFETSQKSYHAFDVIKEPGNKGRKSFGVYYYIDVGAVEVPPAKNTTMYIEEALPGYILPSYTLLAEDVLLVKQLLDRRDDKIKDLYTRLNAREQEVNKLFKQNKNLRKRNAFLESE